MDELKNGDKVKVISDLKDTAYRKYAEQVGIIIGGYGGVYRVRFKNLRDLMFQSNELNFIERQTTVD